jgi:hypothetical protein
MPATAARATAKSDAAEWGHLHCSLCGKDGDHVRFLAAGVTGGTICDACCFKAFWIFLRAYVRHPFGVRT